MIIEKHFSSRVERVWDGEDYEKVKDERKLSVIECPECGEELEECTQLDEEKGAHV